MSDHVELVRRFVACLDARDWETWAGLLSPDVVYEIPQTRECIRGRDRYLAFNQSYPGDWHLRAKLVLADDSHGVVWFDWTVGEDGADGVAFFEFDAGLISRVTDFWPESYDPPDHRPDFVERW